MTAQREEIVRRSRNYSIHVRDLDDGSGKVMYSVIRSEWHPGQGTRAEQLSMEWVDESQLLVRLQQLVSLLRHLNEEAALPLD